MRVFLRAMTEAPPVSPDIAMLARLAEVGMAAVERVHAQLMAAADNEDLNDLARSQARLSRCVRQTLLLKARLSHDAAVTAEREEILARHRPPPPDPRARARALRIHHLQHAMIPIAHAVGHRGEAAVGALCERIDVEISDWLERDDFSDADLDAQVRWLCAQLGYPAELADTWRDLEHPDDAEPPWGWPADAQHATAGADAQPLHESSG